MKHFCFLMICLSLLAACKKPVVLPPSSYSYSFIANAVQYTGNGYMASYKRDSASGKLVFQALFFKNSPSDSLFISLTIKGDNYIDTGTYSNVGPLAYHDMGFQGYLYGEDYGTYSITKLDTTNHLISGNFQFRGNCSVQAVLYENVSDGVFTNLTYKTQ